MYEGYISWPPKVEFEDTYEQVDGLSFGVAADATKKGFQVARAGWNGSDRFIYLVPETVINIFG
jgi:hypothetical protein